MKNAVIIYNGIKKNNYFFENISYISTYFEKKQFNVIIYETKCVGDLSRYVESLEDLDLIIISGGDGTMNELTNGLYKLTYQPEVLYFPTGTVGDFAHSLSLKSDVDYILSLYEEQKILSLDIGIFQNKAFNYIACAGAVNAVSYTTNQKVKERIGSVAYVLESLLSVEKFAEEIMVDLEIDGEQLAGKYTFIALVHGTSVANMHHLLQEPLNSGMMSIILANTLDPRVIAKASKFLITGIPPDVDMPGLVHKRFKTIRISTACDGYWNFDGEKGLSTHGSYEINVHPNGIKIYGLE